MIQFLVIAAIVVVAVIAAILGLAASKPNTFRVERSTNIKAPPEKIFAIVNDFHNWGAWSPWEKLDLAMHKAHSGAGSGKGAVYEWDGNKKVGQGRMEIVESSPPRKLVIKLDFFRPFTSHNTAEYTFVPQGDATHVTWAMYGPNLFMGKVMCLFMNMDAMIGKDFETGLANLKAVAEKLA